MIEIATFERDAANNVKLLARWSIFQGAERTPIVLRTSRIEQAVADPSYNAAVVAMNTVLGKLCEEIATVIVGAGG